MFISTAFAQTGEHAAAAAGGHGDRVFPPFDFSFFSSHIFWLVICFGLFYIFMARVVLPRIGGIIEMRRDRIASDLDQAARMKEESDTAIATYEEALAEARSRAGTIGQTAADEAKAKADAERAEVEAALEKKLAEAEKHIAGIRDKAMQDVGRIAEETAAELVQKLVGVQLDKVVVAQAIKSLRD